MRQALMASHNDGARTIYTSECDNHCIYPWQTWLTQGTT
jgi:hypothetical protein